MLLVYYSTFQLHQTSWKTLFSEGSEQEETIFPKSLSRCFFSQITVLYIFSRWKIRTQMLFTHGFFGNLCGCCFVMCQVSFSSPGDGDLFCSNQKETLEQILFWAFFAVNVFLSFSIALGAGIRVFGRGNRGGFCDILVTSGSKSPMHPWAQQLRWWHLWE